MEAQASTVFRRLNYLTQCVIFFDEFEEFFRDRKEENDGKRKKDQENNNTLLSAKVNELRKFGHNGAEGRHGFSPHDRTIAAFTTSAMLPRLQELHDAGRSLIILATNHFEKLDEAIVRAGRFDFKEEINHPEKSRFETCNGGYFLYPTRRSLDELHLKREQQPELQMVAKVIAEILDDSKSEA